MLRLAQLLALAGAVLVACEGGLAPPAPAPSPARLGTLESAVVCSGSPCKCGSANCGGTASYCSSHSNCADNAGGDTCCECTNAALGCGSNCQVCSTAGTSSVGCSGSAEPAATACNPTCAPGFLNLDGDDQNGCEAQCSTGARCGLQCATCELGNTTSNLCEGGSSIASTLACVPACDSTDDGYKNLDGDGVNGCEECTSAALGCGSNCQVCSTTGTTSVTCAGRTLPASASCAPSCAAGHANLDGNGQTGCEQCILAAACGSDCRVCEPNNAASNPCSGNTQPAATSCVPTCNSATGGYKNLDNDGQNGCEACTSSTLGCGSNCQVCQLSNTTTNTCSGRTLPASTSCIPVCNSTTGGYKNLDGNGATGCEACVDKDKGCGSDCQVCQLDNADSAICSGRTAPAASACVPSCNSTTLGYKNLDNDGQNGCEACIDAHLGCGSDCQLCQDTNAVSVSCSSRTAPATTACVPECNSTTLGYKNLDDNGLNGCEACIDKEKGCGSDCQVCQTTNASSTRCSGRTDPSATACQPDCLPGFDDLDGDGANGCEACTDANHCGRECLACSRENTTTVTCSGNTEAAATACQPSCAPGHLNENDDGLDGCELTCDQPDRCGTTCKQCPEHPNAIVSCSDHEKEPAQACTSVCSDGWYRPDQYSECETPCATAARCGTDCAPCLAAVHAEPACNGNTAPAAQACGLSCEAGYVDDDGERSNGCEACAAGYYDRATAPPALCERCDLDQYCGAFAEPFCRDCTIDMGDGRKCVSSRCGCDDDVDCPEGKPCQHHSCVIVCAANADCPENDQRCCGPEGEKVCLLWGKEICDGKDNDCNGVVDDQLDQADAPLCDQQEGVCALSRIACVDGLRKACDEAVYAAHSPDFQARETLCDGKDNDCNGLTDETGCQPDAGAVARPDAARPFTGETYDLGGCGCQQAVGSGALASLALLLAGAGLRRRRRGDNP